jgi:hypothetical protein
VISRIPDIWRKAKNAKNSLSPINKIPPETLAQVVAFLEPGHQLVNATAVCRHWRATLLSFPRLWSTIHFPDPMQFEAYLKRSKSAPLEVRLVYFSLFKSLVPHTSRLAALAIRVAHSSDFNQVAQYLPNPIPTLHKFTIISSGLNILELPSGIGIDHFMHVRELELEDFSSFQAPCAFPRVTKLIWRMSPPDGDPVQLLVLLNTLERLPVLEEAHLDFQISLYPHPRPHVVTLPRLRRMSLRCSKDWRVEIPRILEFLKLPGLTSLVVDAAPELPTPFPATSFGEHLPTLAELPEMEVYIPGGVGRVRFRSPSQAVLDYRAIGEPSGRAAYSYDRWFWGGLPLHSVRRLVVKLGKRDDWVDVVWLVCLLRDLRSLEHLEFEGRGGRVLRRLRRLLMRRDIHLRIKTLTVRSAVHDTHQVMRLKDVADGLGLEIIVTRLPDPEVVSDGWSLDEDSPSEGWDLSD